MRFHESLQKFAEAHRFNQAQLAAHIGVSKSTMGDWWKGRTQPTVEQACQLAAILCVSLDELAGCDGAISEGLLEPDEPADVESYRSLKATGLLDKDKAISGLSMAVGLGKPSSAEMSPHMAVEPRTGKPIQEAARISKRKRG